MLRQEANIYAIPGWSFKSSVFNVLNNENFNITGLDYIHLSQLPLVEIAQCLSSSLPNQAVLLGWSFGGLIAIKIASLYPKKVKKLVLMNSQPKLVSSLNWTGINQVSAQNFEEALVQNFKKQMSLFIRLASQPSKSPITKETLDAYLFKNLAQELTSFLGLLFESDLRSEYRHLESEIFHIISEKDAVIHQNIAQLYELNSRISTCTLPATGHTGFLTNPTTYIHAIKVFLNDNQSEKK